MTLRQIMDDLSLAQGLQLKTIALLGKGVKMKPAGESSLSAQLAEIMQGHNWGATTDG